jgi:hypothetical protein
MNSIFKVLKQLTQIIQSKVLNLLFSLCPSCQQFRKFPFSLVGTISQFLQPMSRMHVDLRGIIKAEKITHI